ncbi:AAA family ATPase [Flavobacterium sp. 102]|uniref:AAA family ATPase n=1 Tax=Flavobacterium sp. 102 TaxID=2135623 RepID=UPI0013149517|nr:AAA family ATPase [Flavobacterium sp. 102]
MNQIIIKNIGPITDVNIQLNKVNVFMGPQSSGKSTIAKIISFCQWVEKRYLLDGSFDYDFEDQFIIFHRVSDTYFSKTSYFEYNSEYISIKHVGKTYKLEISEQKNSYNFKKSRNIYIPAERNFVSAIPNLRRYNESNDNIMSFLYDWFEVKKKYTRKKSLPILKFPVSYFYSEDNDRDILKLNNIKKELQLKDSSSGLQSLVPLFMLVEYLTNDFFKENKSSSVNEKEEIANTFIKNFGYIIDNLKRLDDLKEALKTTNTFDLSKSEADKVITLISNKKDYHFINFILEEPEQNLFPETQKDLIYYLFEKIQNKKHPHNLTITTHSPFILYAINNCLMGHVIKRKMPKEERAEMQSLKAWLDPKLVSIWQVNDGELTNVIDERTGTVTKHYFNQIMNEVMNEYYDMLNYFQYDSKIKSQST